MIKFKLSFLTLFLFVFSAASLNAQVTFDMKFSGGLSSNEGIVVLSNGEVLVADHQNNRIKRFDNDGNFISSFGSAGSGNGQFNHPSFIAIASNGDILVTEEFGHRVQRFDSNGNYLSQFGSSGSGNGQFRQARGIGFAQNGDILVVDVLNGRVQRFNSDGTFQSIFATGLGEPCGLAVADNGDVWVPTRNDFKVFRYSDAGGAPIGEIGSGAFGSADGEFDRCYDVSIDLNGDLWVIEQDGQRFQQFDSEGNFISKFGGTQGSGDGQFAWARGIHVDDSGLIWVSDSGNNRVQRFSLPNDVPTLSEWGLIILALSLMTLGVLYQLNPSYAQLKTQ